MSQRVCFSVRRQTDLQLARALSAIATELIGEDSASPIQFDLGGGVTHQSTSEGLESDEALRPLLQAGVFHCRLVRLSFPTGGSIEVERQASSDQATITLPNPTFEKIARVRLSVGRHLTAVDSAAEALKVLSVDAHQYYTAREGNLTRLETQVETLGQRVSTFFERLAELHRTERERQHAEFEGQRARLAAEIAARETALQEREKLIADQLRQIDERTNQIERRAIHAKLKQLIVDRRNSPRVSKATSQLRTAVHLFCVALLLITLAAVTYNAWLLERASDSTTLAVGLVRVVLPALAFGATSLFYLRWMNQWFKDHQVDELSLRRMELDVDRASWLVEMVLEWHEARGEPLPAGLLESLSRGLFEGGSAQRPVEHPVEQLGELLRSASGIDVRLPGGSGISYDRRAVRRLEDSVPPAPVAGPPQGG